MSFMEIPCSLINIDANDPNGQSQSLHLDQQHHVWKHRIKYETNGRQTFIGRKSKLELGSTLLDEKDLIEHLEDRIEETESSDDTGDKCGSCYGAGEEDECCNSCEDVRRAYRTKGWNLPALKEISQCVKEGIVHEEEGEGCNVHGKVALSSGGGNLHLAPGRDPYGQTTSLLDMLRQTFANYNVTHILHKLRFGPDYPNAANQLDGVTRSIVDGHGMYQYYVKIVPTTYRYRNGTTIVTNQYSVTEHLRHVEPGSNRGLPGVFFMYEVSPLHVEIRETYQTGWVAFLTSVCAVVGGVVTVAGMLDQFLYSQGKGRLDTLGR